MPPPFFPPLVNHILHTLQTLISLMLQLRHRGVREENDPNNNIIIYIQPQLCAHGWGGCRGTVRWLVRWFGAAGPPLVETIPATSWGLLLSSGCISLYLASISTSVGLCDKYLISNLITRWWGYTVPELFNKTVWLAFERCVPCEYSI